MMKNFKISLLGLMISSFTACDAPKDVDENLRSHSTSSEIAHSALAELPKSEIDLPSDKLPDSPFPIENEFNSFEVHNREITLSAQINSFGEAKILEYPAEWRSHANLARYDGGAKSPFSKEHCQEIRKLAETGGGIFIRNSHHSLVEFLMPFFLTYEFSFAVVEAAEAAGLPTTNLEIVNPPQTIGSGTLELRFKDDAISPKSGDVEYLYEQLHFRYKGIDKGARRILTVFSGDILCDLAEGNVEMIMTYPIKGEERTVKLIYDNLDTVGAE